MGEEEQFLTDLKHVRAILLILIWGKVFFCLATKQHLRSFLLVVLSDDATSIPCHVAMFSFKMLNLKVLERLGARGHVIVCADSLYNSLDSVSFV